MSRTYYIFSPGRLKRRDNTLALEKDDERKIIPVEAVVLHKKFSQMSTPRNC